MISIQAVKETNLELDSFTDNKTHFKITVNKTYHVGTYFNLKSKYLS